MSNELSHKPGASLDIAYQRLYSQHMAAPPPGKPGDAVAWLGAVQAQDYAGAKWSLGLRLQGAGDDDIENAFTDGAILRTHLLRPTWHFVTPADIHWMLALTAPRVHTVNAYMYRKLELDGTTCSRCNTVLAEALQGGRQRTRDELGETLQKAGIATENRMRLSYLMMQAELDGIVCSGPRRGKQFTYALLDERAPRTRRLNHEEALAELAWRYFASRGPATVQDFARWSGLTVADSRHGLEAVKNRLQREVVDGNTYWFVTQRFAEKRPSPRAHLLPIYDEYISGYKDRSAMIDADMVDRLNVPGNAVINFVVVDGRIVGTWKRTLRKRKVIIGTTFLVRLTETEQEAVEVAVHQYGDFLGLPVVPEYTASV